MKLPIHVAMALYCPDREQKDRYLLELAKTRLRLFAEQNWVDTCTVITVVHRMDEITREILELLKGKGNFTKRLGQLDVVLLSGVRSPHGGLTQVFSDTDCEWIYYSDDAHVIPLKSDSVFRFVEEAVCEFRQSEVIVESDLTPLPAEKFSGHGYVREYGVRWDHPWYKNEEYGMAMKNTLRDRGYYFPPGGCRHVHGMMMAAQGLAVSSNPRHGELFLHHGLYVGPNAIKFKKPARLAPRIYPEINQFTDLRGKIAEKIENLRATVTVEDRWTL